MNQIPREERQGEEGQNRMSGKIVKTFIVREFVSGESGVKSLIPLQALVSKLQWLFGIFSWAFKDVTISCREPLGLSVADFEKLTRELKLGLVVSDSDFHRLLDSGLEFQDGVIEVYLAQCGFDPALKIECVDCAQWEISSSIESINCELERRGFIEQ